MRYSSSKLVMKTGSFSLKTPTTQPELHYKKDDTLDMRYSSSKKAIAVIASRTKVKMSPSAANSSRNETPEKRKLCTLPVKPAVRVEMPVQVIKPPA